MISSVLIANRGEIACRIILTARKMGIRTIAVYSDVDHAARHVELADEAHLIGPAVAAQSYLDADKLLAVAKASGAEAIHPGYGFLSENADFAEQVTQAGLVWVGPPAEAIRAMGLKDAAKSLMEKAGVPVVPGYHGDNQDIDFLRAQAGEIGYPVLIKAVAGGGGKGMRKVDAADQFDKAIKSAQREARSSFGDDRVLVEKFVLSPRHIEMQIFGDRHGSAVHLFERDCSLQRRHQKVVEEAPAPGMTEAVRAAMGKAAVEAARAINYEGAGTVEFIVDGREGLKEDGFFFMEMNTRLQVEHPVTEMITGQDLVEWQFIVASGGTLPKTQSELNIHGHSFETRLYAEDPQKNFFPSPGILHHLKFPEESGSVRVETGVRPGDEVTMYYDPMIAKLVTWGETRDAALARMSIGLGEVEVIGVRTNAAFLSRIAAHKAFQSAQIDTAFIEQYHDELIPETALPTATSFALVALYLSLKAKRSESEEVTPWDAGDGWRLNSYVTALTQKLSFIVGDDLVQVLVGYDAHSVKIGFGEIEISCHGTLEGTGTISAIVEGKPHTAEIREFGGEIHLLENGHLHSLTLKDALEVAQSDDAGGNHIAAPMSGKIISVLAEAGARARKGDPLVVLEAMKMEHTLAAPRDLTIDEVLVKENDQVDEGQAVVLFDEEGI
jgi:3-methylcrotonyl-CoA carboxylase alpha subunit